VFGKAAFFYSGEAEKGLICIDLRSFIEAFHYLVFSGFFKLYNKIQFLKTKKLRYGYYRKLRYFQRIIFKRRGGESEKRR